MILQSNLSKKKNKMTPTCLQEKKLSESTCGKSTLDSLGELSNTSRVAGVFGPRGYTHWDTEVPVVLCTSYIMSLYDNNDDNDDDDDDDNNNNKNNKQLTSIVCQDSRRGMRNFSMACVDVKKAYDSVDHKWMREIFSLHRFLKCIGRAMEKLRAQ